MDENSSVKIRCPNAGKDFAPEEISAQVLRKLSADAAKFLNDKVEKAVITVPAYFNDSQRQVRWPSSGGSTRQQHVTATKQQDYRVRSIRG